MTVIELLILEIRTSYGYVKEDREFLVHCSKSFNEGLYKSFIWMGYVIPTSMDNGQLVDTDKEGPVITLYQIPNLGRFRVKVDMEQGYRIEKLTNEDI